MTTTSALTAVENKMPIVSNLVKKTGCNTKINEIEKKITDQNHGRYITTPEFNKSTAEIIALRLKQENLARKKYIANFVNKTDFDNKLKHVASNENELNKLSKKVKAVSIKGLKKDLNDQFSILNGAKYFPSRIFENYLVFIPTKKTLNNLVALVGLNRRNLMVCRKKVLKK